MRHIVRQDYSGISWHALVLSDRGRFGLAILQWTSWVEFLLFRRCRGIDRSGLHVVPLLGKEGRWCSIGGHLRPRDDIGR